MGVLTGNKLISIKMNIMKTSKLLVGLMLALVGSSAMAQNFGSVDPSFTAAFPVNVVTTYAVQPQADGNILVGVNDANNIGLFKLKSDGSPDLTFNFGQYDIVYDIDILPNGNIVIGSKVGVHILSSDGTLQGELKGTTVKHVEALSDGKVLFGDTALHRLNENGTLDISFSKFSPAGGVVRGLEVQSDGRILVSDNNGLKRLTEDGATDVSFDASAIDATSSPNIKAIAVQSDGKIIVAGKFKFNGGFFDSHIGRLNADGTKDATFAPTVPSEVNAVAVQSNDKIVMGGYFTSPSSRVARLNADGTVDSDFNVGTGCDNTVFAVAVQKSDGNILVGGNFTNVNGQSKSRIVRLLGDNNLRASVCIVTVDSITGKNQVNWQREWELGIDHYSVYKESTIAGQYTKIGDVFFGDESTFTDTSSNPQQKSDRYTITAVDSNGVESPINPDEAHKTIHLGISLGITPGSYNLEWDDLEGFDFTTYYIYRISNAGLELIDSISKSFTSYTDLPPAGATSYVVAVEKLDACDTDFAGKRTIKQRSISNIKKKPITTGVYDLNGESINLGIFPNPTSGMINVSFSLAETSEVLIEVYDVVGSKVAVVSNETMDFGAHKVSYDLSTEINTAGTYLVRVNIGSVQHTQRLMVTK